MRFIICLMLTSAVYGDVITLRGGSRLEGVLESLESSVLTVSTSDTKPFVLNWSRVSAIETDEIIYVHLKDGRNLSGKLSMEQNGNATISVFFPPIDQKAGSVQTHKSEIEMISHRPFPEVIHKWKGFVGINGTYQSGNVEKRAVGFRLGAFLDIYHYNELSAELDMRADFTYEQANGRLINRDGSEKIGYAHYIAPDWNAYVLEELSFSKPENLKIRIDVEAGLGWVLLNFPAFKMTIRNGIGRIDSYYDVKVNDHDGFFAYVPGVIFWAKHRLFTFDSFTYGRFDLGEVSNHILSSFTSVTIPMNERYEFILSYKYNFNSKPPPKTKNFDNKATLTFAHYF